jgi:FHS family L-fucose permease-like MFS transporter
VFFAAFGIVSLPAAALLVRLGTIRTVLIALVMMIAGCLVVQTIAWTPRFAILLGGLFVLASGIVTLQVAANPLAAAVGPPARAHFRLTLAQSFNALGVVAGVHFGAALLLGDAIFHAPAQHAGLVAVQRAFLTIAGLIALLLAAFWLVRGPIEAAAPESDEVPRIRDAFQSRWAWFGAGTLALYVGAEVAIGSIMISFLADPRTLGLSFAEAGRWLANFYWGGALVGRFLGSWLLTRIAAPRVLAGAALVAMLLCVATLVVPGPVAARCALAIGLFNSVMFPTIFSLTLERSTATPAATSGLLCVAIAGGAAIPLLVGQIADRVGLEWVFVVPIVAYAGILAFALASRVRR